MAEAKKQVQRNIIVKLVLFATLLVVAAVAISYLKNIRADFQRQHTWLQNDVRELNNRLRGLNQKTLEFSEAVRTWEGLPEGRQRIQGLRINDAKEVIDRLEKKHHLSTLTTSFSKPEEINGDYVTETVKLISSTVSMRFNALTDAFALAFVEDIKREFPGYIQVRSLSINRSGNVTREILQRIANGEKVGLVTVNFDFYWHDLRYQNPSGQASGGQWQ